MQTENPATARQQRWFPAGPILAGLALAGLAGGCATTHGAQIDASRLAGVPPDQMTLVTDQQRALDAAISDEDAAKQAKLQADDRVMQAESERDVAVAQHKQAETQAKLAKRGSEDVQKSGTTDAKQLVAAQERVASTDRTVRDAQALVDADNAKVDYLKSLSNLADGNIKLAQRQIDLDKAELERARLLTLKKTNPAEVHAMKVQPADFDAAVAKRESDVAGQNAKVAEDRADATRKYHEWQVRNEGVERTAQKPSERASVPPPPRG